MQDNQNQVSNEVLANIYSRLGDLQAGVAAVSASSTATASRIHALVAKMEDLDKDVKGLAKQEAKNAIKWGILTFAATTLLVTGMNYAIGEERPQLQAIPPSYKELGQAELISRDGPWGDK